MTRHKRVVAQYLSEHYQPFFEAYNKLLRSSNYVTRRQSLKVRGGRHQRKERQVTMAHGKGGAEECCSKFFLCYSGICCHAHRGLQHDS